jgi:hypothetical protein
MCKAIYITIINAKDTIIYTELKIYSQKDFSYF